MRKDYLGLKQIKKKGSENKFSINKENKIKKKKNIKYDEKHAKFLLVKYKKFGDINAKNDLISMCYPIIFSVLKIVGKKINTTKMLFNHDDLFNEGILIIDKCIGSYKLKYKVQFMTFIWVSLHRGFIRFIDNNLLKPNKIFVSIKEHNDEEKDLEILENVYDKKKVRQEVNGYLKNETIDSLENDYFKDFTELESKVIYLKYKKYDAEEITSILEINISKYYKILKKIKEKTKRSE